MTQTFVAMYHDFETARKVVEELVDAGFTRDSISLVANDTTTRYGDSLNSSDQIGGADGDVEAPEGAGFGAVVGTLIGLGAALIPGVGPVIAGGTLGIAALSAGLGAAAGAVTGGLTASLVDLGIPENDANAYAEGIRRGGAMVSMTVDDDQAGQAEIIMNRYSPIDLDQQSSYYQESGWSGYSPNAAVLGADEIHQERENFRSRTLDAGDQAKLEVVQEELQVGKKQVERGAMRIRSYVTEVPVQEQVTLREEHVTIERHAVDRPASAADLNAFQDKVIEVTEHAEVPVVSKQARVVEEVIIGKESTEHTETISDTVRRVDVDVEGSPRTFESYDTTWRNHFSQHYGSSGSYDQYMPAYRYGYDLRSSNQYRGSNWSDVEHNIRSDWEKQNPNTWDQFKDAIRSSWDNITQ